MPRHTESPSIQILKNAMARKGMSRKQFVQATGLSYEYVSRVFNNRVPFPTPRERLESFGEILGIDPMVFIEYQEIMEYSSPSVELIWSKLNELGLSRSEYAERVDASRTYVYEVLRGDVPFPKRNEMIEKFAAPLGIEPTDFEEYSSPEKWVEQNPGKAEIALLKAILQGRHKVNVEGAAQALGVHPDKVRAALLGID